MKPVNSLFIYVMAFVPVLSILLVRIQASVQGGYGGYGGWRMSPGMMGGYGMGWPSGKPV